MRLSYSTIIHGDTFSYAGRIATLIRVTGGPFKVPYLSKMENEDPTLSEDTEFFQDLILKQVREDGETTAVVFTGIEPLWQGNAIFELTKKLREVGFFVKIETAGFYANEIRTIGDVANVISLDYKTILNHQKYLPLIGEKAIFEVFQSNFLKSLTFMEHSKAFKEIKTTIIPGVNDSVEIIENIARNSHKACDQYALQQFVPWPTPLMDQRFEKTLPPNRLQLLELGQVARKHVGRVLVRCHEAEEQEVLPKSQRA